MLPFSFGFCIILLDFGKLVFEHGFFLRVEVNLFIQICCLIGHLLNVLFHSFNLDVQLLVLLLLVLHLVVIVGLHRRDLVLPITCLTECVLDGLILGLDLLARVPDHSFNEELAVTQFANAPFLWLLKLRARH